MRLRLIIERNGLPTTPVIWTTSSTGGNDTISQLLERVNEVIPLESDEWGLDDYAVEINGYECLHFQEVEAVLKEDDQVRIRPLHSLDLRARRLSGRHQISHAGRHLIDGVPFGKPFLRRAPDRPAIDIPPRKRRRVICEEGEQDNSAELSQQLVRRSDFVEENPDGEGEDDEEDEDFEMDDDSGDGSCSDSSSALSGSWKVLFAPKRGKDGKNVANGVGGRPHTTNVGQGGTAELGPTTKPTVRRSSLRSDDSITRAEKTVNFEGIQNKGKPNGSSIVRLGGLDDVEDDKDSSDDEDFQPGNDSEECSSNSEGCEKTDSESDSDSDSSSGTSSSSSDSDSDSEPEEISSHSATKVTPTTTKTSKLSSEASAATKAPSLTAPPGQGRVATQKRNQRRRDSKKLRFLKSTGELPEHATIADLQQWRDARFGTNRHGSGMGSSHSSGTKVAKANDSLEARRMELLAAIESGGVKVGDSPSGAGSATSRGEDLAARANSSPAVTKTDAQKTPDDASQSRPRAKLDITSSRRMLFGSLGVKAPRNKEDEEKLKADFATSADNGRRKAARTSQEGEKIWPNQRETEPSQVEVIDGSWKDKIVLRAVECCHEGIELSTPPFPFQQRWDPQQQGGYSKPVKRGKGKKRKRNQAQYYEQDEHYHGTRDEQTYADAGEGLELNYDDPIESNGSGGANRAVAEQVQPDLRGASAAVQESIVEDDLPSLPTDIASLPDFTKAEMQPNATVAFKQLTVSENWQPVISKYRTAVVKSVEEGRYMTLVLAKRDIVLLDKQFDETTGDRIWGKFEMPDADEEVDPSLLELEFSDLIEPKLVQVAPAAIEAIPGNTTADPIKENAGLQQIFPPKECAYPRQELASEANRKSLGQDSGDEVVLDEKPSNNSAMDMAHALNPVMLQT